MSSSRIRLTHDAYRVGWITALPLEMAAAFAMLDASHAPLPQPKGDHNTYHLGEIGDHNIVIACLPTGIYGLTSAAVVAQQMLSTFPSIDIGLMVGIGGGVPSASADVRLGDVIVSKPTGLFPGVIQYDYGKTVADGSFHRTGSLNNPPERLLTAISDLQAKHKMGDSNIALHLTAAARSRPSMQSSFVYPGESEDILFESSYVHEADQYSCATCDKTRIVSRPRRDSQAPYIHYGLIASANQLMKDASTRDRLGEELGILCFEMEAAGLMNHFPCLVIRGTCDYSDSHKNKQWQDYAAGTAAAYARELLQSSVPSTATLPKRDDPIKIRSRIPISKSALFGREVELEQLRSTFDVTRLARQFAVIWGLSGYGKTQLAIEYLTSRDDNYDSILWIDSSSRGMAEESFEQVSLRLGSPTNPQQSGAERVIEWLEQEANRSWLIVFDGVETLDDFDHIDSFDIRDYFPTCKHGHLLLVTTSPERVLRASPRASQQNVSSCLVIDALHLDTRKC
jgi:nucleoside phosphorylase